MEEYKCWYSVWDIDAWLEDDGEDEFWEYNAKTKIAQIELPSDDECNLSLEDIINALYEAEIITTNDWRKFNIEEYGAYPHPSLAIIDHATEEPLFEINFERTEEI